MVFSSYYILSNRWRSSVIITLIIMGLLLTAINLLSKEPEKEEIHNSIEINITYIPEKKVEVPKIVTKEKASIPIEKKSPETIEEKPEKETKEEPFSPHVISFNDLKNGLKLPYPSYPKSAIRWKKQGIVEVKIFINIDGSIKNVEVIKSSGHSILDNQCIKTIMEKWKFSPQKTEVITNKRFVFKLK